MKMQTKLAGLGALSAALLASLPAWAQEATAETVEAVVEAAAPVMDKGDVSWMMIFSVLVLFMTVPGLALFYGGLVRSKNMLSTVTPPRNSFAVPPHQGEVEPPKAKE